MHKHTIQVFVRTNVHTPQKDFEILVRTSGNLEKVVLGGNFTTLCEDKRPEYPEEYELRELRNDGKRLLQTIQVLELFAVNTGSFTEGVKNETGYILHEQKCKNGGKKKVVFKRLASDLKTTRRTLKKNGLRLAIS